MCIPLVILTAVLRPVRHEDLQGEDYVGGDDQQDQGEQQHVEEAELPQEGAPAEAR